MNNRIENLLISAWLISLVATLGSLYFSIIKQFEPCTLCWYQRILMYPLVILLLVGTLKKDAGVALYSLIFSVIGILFSSYHYANQKLAAFQEVAPSCGRIPCTGQYINWFGFMTIPFLALIAFIMIACLSIMILRMSKGRN
ncbi:disulfide oxidoreductase [Bacillus sp. FJAT-45037]|uniref:disulfide oxidoreductase n=1 Tax=Bacillus sp. FJAT-45037 TaxID=2011007 RepID=UPI000C23A0D9|nr:disulfide oxidoreductase [Bacillus sp. FJAT-45037]